MNRRKLKLCIAVLFGFGITGLQAQAVIPASGGDASGSGGTVSYTIGQLVYTTNSGSGGSVIQGIQQPFEISVISGLPDDLGSLFSLSVYPNPTSGLLVLKTSSSGPLSGLGLQYKLFDIKGNLLDNRKLKSNETDIDLGSFLPAAYFLKVFRDNKEIKTFKIIKNQ